MMYLLESFILNLNFIFSSYHIFMLIAIALTGLLFLLKTPVFIVFTLILITINCVLTLFYFNLDFLGLALLIVYIGAIAILFLFVIMLLNFKIINKPLNYLHLSIYLILFIVLGLIFYFLTLEFYLNYLNIIKPENINLLAYYLNCTLYLNYFWLTFLVISNSFLDQSEFIKYSLSSGTSLESLSFFFYNYYYGLLIFLGFFLCITLIGIIYITVRTLYYNKISSVSYQLKQDLKNIYFY
jgi:NADH:ubiquinone oxidoreductase subunit 6 (subunit J)